MKKKTTKRKIEGDILNKLEIMKELNTRIDNLENQLKLLTEEKDISNIKGQITAYKQSLFLIAKTNY